MSSKASQYNIIKVKATNAINLPLYLGFKPDKVVVQNLSNNVMIEWNRMLPAGYAFKTVAAGTRTLLTAGAIDLLDGTSTKPPGAKILTALADINDTTTEDLIVEGYKL